MQTLYAAPRFAPMDESALERRLENWGRAYRDGWRPNVSPGFRHYRPEPQPRDRSSPGLNTDLRDAECIQNAWETLCARDRLLLAEWYIHRAALHWIIRQANKAHDRQYATAVRRHSLEFFMRGARGALSAVLGEH